VRRFVPALPLLAALAVGPALTPGARPSVLPEGRRALTAGHRVAAPPADSLRALITARIARVAGAEVSVWFEDLARGDTLTIGAGRSFHAASTMKLPVMIELFRRVDAGETSLADELYLQNVFESIVDRSRYVLDAGEDSDSALYALVGQNVRLGELNERMITRSSNLAANTLIQFLDPRRVNATARALGARDIQVLRGVEDGKAFAQGLNNTTTAQDLGVLLTAIQRNRAASRASCDSMRRVLLRQEFHDEIPAGLPAGTSVAHKTGSITGTLHDAAIVYPPRRGPYVLVVLTRGIPERKDAQALIADVSRAVYAFATRR